MLGFIDESGHPHPHDSSTRPVVVAVCLSESDARRIGGRIHSLKRDILQRERIELKGTTFLKRSTFRRKPNYVAFLEELFSAILNFPLTIFAVIMERPTVVIPTDETRLPNRFRYLIQRIELLAEDTDEMATLMFDGHGGLFGGICWQFNGFLYRSDEGRAYTHITDAPSFVDSQTSTGIQIADMAASVLRQYQEAELYRTPPPPGDQYLLAIRRYYRILEQKTRDDLTSPDGHSRRGFYIMPSGEL